jgi:hypothetical protein
MPNYKPYSQEEIAKMLRKQFMSKVPKGIGDLSAKELEMMMKDPAYTGGLGDMTVAEQEMLLRYPLRKGLGDMTVQEMKKKRK